MDKRGYDRIVSITEANRATLSELKSVRDLLRDYLKIEEEEDKICRVKAALEWHRRVQEQLRGDPL